MKTSKKRTCSLRLWNVCFVLEATALGRESGLCEEDILRDQTKLPRRSGCPVQTRFFSSESHAVLNSKTGGRPLFHKKTCASPIHRFQPGLVVSAIMSTRTVCGVFQVFSTRPTLIRPRFLCGRTVTALPADEFGL